MTHEIPVRQEELMQLAVQELHSTIAVAGPALLTVARRLNDIKFEEFPHDKALPNDEQPSVKTHFELTAFPDPRKLEVDNFDRFWPWTDNVYNLVIQSQDFLPATSLSLLAQLNGPYSDPRFATVQIGFPTLLHGIRLSSNLYEPQTYLDSVEVTSLPTIYSPHPHHLERVHGERQLAHVAQTSTNILEIYDHKPPGYEQTYSNLAAQVAPATVLRPDRFENCSGTDALNVLLISIAACAKETLLTNRTYYGARHHRQYRWEKPLTMSLNSSQLSQLIEIAFGGTRNNTQLLRILNG